MAVNTSKQNQSRFGGLAGVLFLGKEGTWFFSAAPTASSKGVLSFKSNRVPAGCRRRLYAGRQERSAGSTSLTGEYISVLESIPRSVGKKDGFGSIHFSQALEKPFWPGSRALR